MFITASFTERDRDRPEDQPPSTDRPKKPGIIKRMIGHVNLSHWVLFVGMVVTIIMMLVLAQLEHKQFEDTIEGVASSSYEITDMSAVIAEFMSDDVEDVVILKTDNERTHWVACTQLADSSIKVHYVSYADTILADHAPKMLQFQRLDGETDLEKKVIGICAKQFD